MSEKRGNIRKRQRNILMERHANSNKRGREPLDEGVV